MDDPRFNEIDERLKKLERKTHEHKDDKKDDKKK